MQKIEPSDEFHYPSPKEMQGWLEREITDVTKAMELRIREASSFVVAYAQGEISADETAQRCSEYQSRWGDPLPGVPRSHGFSDSEIVDRINETRIKQGLLERYTGIKKGGRGTSR